MVLENDSARRTEKKYDKGRIMCCAANRFSKAFGCIVHDFLIVKLEAYGLSYETLKVTHGYLTDRKHRTKIKHFFSVLFIYLS